MRIHKTLWLWLCRAVVRDSRGRITVAILCRKKPPDFLNMLLEYDAGSAELHIISGALYNGGDLGIFRPAGEGCEK